jgi:hypothetical protein
MLPKYRTIPKLFFFPLWVVAKFGQVLLWMVANPPTSQIQKKRKEKNIGYNNTCNYYYFKNKVICKSDGFYVAIFFSQIFLK